jgi:hypothetical protein
MRQNVVEVQLEGHNDRGGEGAMTKDLIAFGLKPCSGQFINRC